MVSNVIKKHTATDRCPTNRQIALTTLKKSLLWTKFPAFSVEFIKFTYACIFLLDLTAHNVKKMIILCRGALNVTSQSQWMRSNLVETFEMSNARNSFSTNEKIVFFCAAYLCAV